MEQNSTTINSPERILRIIQKIADANLRSTLRCLDHPTVAVKAKFCGVEKYMLSSSQSVQAIKIDSISFKGIKFLESKQIIQVEFLLSSSKIVFVSKIYEMNKDFILIGIPRKLSTIERRANERFLMSENLGSYVIFDFNSQDQWLNAGCPVYPEYRSLANYFRLSDISMGGACITSFFPLLSQNLEQGFLDPNARILFPLRVSISVKIEIRWVKKIRETKKDEQGKDYIHTIYKFGCEFKDVSQELQTELQHFMKQISQAEAI